MTNSTGAFDYGIIWKEVIVSLKELRMAVDGETDWILHIHTIRDETGMDNEDKKPRGIKQTFR